MLVIGLHQIFHVYLEFTFLSIENSKILETLENIILLFGSQKSAIQQFVISNPKLHDFLFICTFYLTGESASTEGFVIYICPCCLMYIILSFIHVNG